jgi:diguanylate cyclase (GGDEF)-like protein
MNDPSAALAILRERFIRNSASKLDAIDQALGRLRARPADTEIADALLRLFHGFAGIGTTYGFAEVTSTARDAEGVFDRILAEHRAATAGEMLAANESLAAMRKALSGESSQEAAPAEEPGVPDLAVVLVGESVVAAYSAALAKEGYHVIAAATAAEGLRAFEESDPVAIIAAAQLPDGGGATLAEEVRRHAGSELTTVYLAGGGVEFIDRVEAIRCGADAVIEPRLDADDVARMVNAVAQQRRRDPARILSVEDDPDQAAFLQTVLESAGYETRVCSDPVHFEADVTAFRPDLILMDYRLPKISGLELARIFRQQERYATVPIIFLTAESALQRRVEVLRAGADGHLFKPVQPSLLLSAVAATLERARVLRSLIDRDGLTGLLTHSALMERVKSAAALALRHPERSLALVMIDVDHFKSVNDRHGHTAGDRVLVALAALLQRRLRHSDLTGRYGGEEFMIVLDELSEEQARQLIERLLDEFATTDHPLPDGASVRVTFSAGIAMFTPSRSDAAAWIAVADAAMYEAKRGGRNRVVIAS